MDDLNRLRSAMDKEALNALIHEVTPEQADASAAPKPRFVQAAETRAATRNITPEQLLEEYATRLRDSCYPGPECLTPEEVQAIADDGPADSQQEHLAACPPCRQLVDAAHPSPKRLGKLRREREELGRFTQPR
jgi:hypothetical protein